MFRRSLLASATNNTNLEEVGGHTAWTPELSWPTISKPETLQTELKAIFPVATLIVASSSLPLFLLGGTCV